MYSEKSFKNYIFWLQVKRIFLIIILSSIGSALGVLIGKIIESTVQVTSYNNTIIVVSTIVFFLISLLLTVGTGKQVQDSYWKIAVLRKLTVIQKDLELNNELLKKNDKELKLDIIQDSDLGDVNSKKSDEKHSLTVLKNTSLVSKKSKKNKYIKKKISK